jgi:hypothetical protein
VAAPTSSQPHRVVGSSSFFLKRSDFLALPLCVSHDTSYQRCAGLSYFYSRYHVTIILGIGKVVIQSAWGMFIILALLVLEHARMPARDGESTAKVMAIAHSKAL